MSRPDPTVQPPDRAAMRASEPEGAPVFLVGCGRSGTTLLRLMLDSHPDLAIPGESHFMPSLWRTRRRILKSGSDPEALTNRLTSIEHIRRWGVERSRVLARMARLRDPAIGDIVDALYLAYAEQHGASRWGDKTPIYVLSIPVLAEMFPQARFVHMIRDGRDVALSYLSVPWGPQTIHAASRKWRRDVGAGIAAGTALGPGRYLEVRYEHLIARPEEALSRICDHIALPYDEAMLRYHEDAVDRVQSAPAMARFHGSVGKPVTSGMRNWATQMNEDDLLVFEAVAGDLLRRLDYPVRSRSIPRSTRLEAAVRVQALDMAAFLDRARRRARRAVVSS